MNNTSILSIPFREINEHIRNKKELKKQADKRCIDWLMNVPVMRYIKFPDTQNIKLPENQNITIPDRIIKELSIIANILKSQYYVLIESEFSPYPLILDSEGKKRLSGRYIQHMEIISDVELFNIQLYKHFFTERFENTVNTSLLKNQLLEIYQQAIAIRDFYNEKLTSETEIVKEFKKQKEIHFMENPYNAVITINEYHIGQIYLGCNQVKFDRLKNKHDRPIESIEIAKALYEERLEQAKNDFFYSETNMSLTYICQKLIEFIEKFELTKTEQTTKKTERKELTISKEKIDKNTTNKFLFLALLSELMENSIIDKNLKSDFEKLEQKDLATVLNWNDTDWKLIVLMEFFVKAGFFTELNEYGKIDKIVEFIINRAKNKEKTIEKNKIETSYNRAKKLYAFTDFTTKLNEIYSKLGIDLLQTTDK